MNDYNLYSPLFSMGLSLCNPSPLRQLPLPAKSKATSFLALDVKRTVDVSVVPIDDDEYQQDIELDVDEIQYIERKSRDYAYAYATAPSSSSYDAPSPCSTPSPSARTLPLPKPAPISQLPAIPISTMSPTNSKYSSSAAPSSQAIPSSYPPLPTKPRKFHSLAPSWLSGPFGGHPYNPPEVDVPTDVRSVRTISTAVSTNYRKKRRSDALAALEGRRRDGPFAIGGAIGSSFVPSMVHEEDEEEESHPLTSIPFSASAPALVPSPIASTQPSAPLRSHLSLTSTVHTSAPTKFKYDPSQPVPQLPELPADLFILPPPATILSSSASVDNIPVSNNNTANSIRSPLSNIFPSSPRVSMIAGEAPVPPTTAARPVWFGRRASTGTTEIGWGMTFMDLDDEPAATSTNSISTWSAYKLSMIQ